MSNTQTPERMMGNWRRQLTVLGLYVVLTLCMSWPLLLQLRSHVVGSGGDPWQAMWRFVDRWQDLQQWWQGRNENFLLIEFFGGGAARLVNLSVWPWIWLQALARQPLVYNLVWISSFVLSGYSVYLLVSYLLKKYRSLTNVSDWLLVDAGPFIAGLYYMFLPMHVAHGQGHFGALQTQWLPLIALSLLTYIDRPTTKRLLLFVLAVVTQAWIEHHYVLWAFLFVLVLLIARWLLGLSWPNRQALLPPIALVAVLWLFFIILPYWPLVRLGLLEESPLDVAQGQTIRFSADPFAFLVPAAFHPLWGSLTKVLWKTSFTGNTVESTHYLGMVPLLLVIFFHQQIPRQQKYLWGALALTFFFISLGPRLHLLGTVTSLRLPYSVIDGWPVFRAVRTVSRAGVVVGMSLAVLLGWVVATQVRRRTSALTLSALILLDFLFWPLPMQSTTLSAAYAAVRQLPGTRLIELPASTNYAIASRALYASTIHGKEVLGNIALERGVTTPQQSNLRSVPALRHVLYGGANHLLSGRSDFFGQDMKETFSDVVRYYDIAAVLVHLDSLSAIQRKALHYFLEERMLLAPQVYDDVVLYVIERASLPASDGIILRPGEQGQPVRL